MEQSGSLVNLLTQGAIIAFLVFVSFFVLRAMMIPVALLALSAASRFRKNYKNKNAETADSGKE